MVDRDILGRVNVVSDEVTEANAGVVGALQKAIASVFDPRRLTDSRHNEVELEARLRVAIIEGMAVAGFRSCGPSPGPRNGETGDEYNSRIVTREAYGRGYNVDRLQGNSRVSLSLAVSVVNATLALIGQERAAAPECHLSCGCRVEVAGFELSVCVFTSWLAPVADAVPAPVDAQ